MLIWLAAFARILRLLSDHLGHEMGVRGPMTCASPCRIDILAPVRKDGLNATINGASDTRGGGPAGYAQSRRSTARELPRQAFGCTYETRGRASQRGSPGADRPSRHRCDLHGASGVVVEWHAAVVRVHRPRQ